MIENAKYRFKKIKRIFLSIGIAIWIISIIFLLTSKLDGNSVWTGYTVELSSALMCGIIISFTWDYIVESVNEENNRSLLEELDRRKESFRLIEAESAFILAAFAVKDCKSIRAIGTAQQDHDSEKVRDAIKVYLDSTINRIRNKGDRLTYRRITNLHINDKFKPHLEEVYNVNSDKFHDVETMFFNHFTSFYTYLIVDEKFMMLSINSPKGSQTFSPFCLICQNPDVIRLFISQFKAIFEKEKSNNRIVSDLQTFIKSQNIDKSYLDILDDITGNIGRLNVIDNPYKSIIYPQLELIKKNIGELTQQNLKIEHTNSNGNVLNLYCLLLNELKAGESYSTITFFEFWNNIITNSNKVPDFLKANINALRKGAVINRILVIDEKKINTSINKGECLIKYNQIIDLKESIYVSIIQQVIKKNLEIVKEYPNTYNFKILVTNEHNQLRKGFYNFALIKKNDNYQSKILCQPSNQPNDIENTTIYFKNHSEMHESEFLENEQKLEELKRKCSRQNIDNINLLTFLKGIDDEYFSDNDNLRKVFGKYEAI